METTIMENQMEKKMEHEMETVVIRGYIPYTHDTRPATLYLTRRV